MGLGFEVHVPISEMCLRHPFFFKYVRFSCKVLQISEFGFKEILDSPKKNSEFGV